jgi:Zn-dependent peptidase ImmA (M78 family)/DNA-binding XRE family transcriptional regulator
MFVPERLVLARHRRGLKKIELAKVVGKVRQTIADYESGRSEPSEHMIRTFGDLLNFPEKFFYEPLDDLLSPDAVSFRKLTRTPAPQRDAALAVGRLGIALNEWIETEFELPPNDIPDDIESGLVSPADAAAVVRSRWGLGESPIPNMLHLLEAHGVRVFSLADECREVDAFSFWRHERPYICVATYKTAERAIFDVAHELGHLILHRDHAKPQGRREEREADAFASNLLMPESDVVAVAPRNPDLQSLVETKGRWRVSTAALNYRLHDLGFTTDWHYRELCKELSMIGRDRELKPLPHERSQTLTKVFAAMRKEGTAPDAIADAICIYPQELASLTFGLAVMAVPGQEPSESTQPARPNLYVVR